MSSGTTVVVQVWVYSALYPEVVECCSPLIVLNLAYRFNLPPVCLFYVDVLHVLRGTLDHGSVSFVKQNLGFLEKISRGVYIHR
jgi:hypothetical protein